MRLSSLPFGLLLLAGCEGGKIEIGDDTASMSDTDADTDADSDTDTDADSDTDTDTDTDPGPLTNLTFVLDAETDADVLQLDWMSEDFAVSGRLGNAPVAGGTVTVGLATPDESELIEAGAGIWIRYALPYVFVDEDGDGLHDGDEEIRGVGSVWPVYITGDIPIEYGALGIVDGWNALLVAEGDTPEAYDLDAVPLPVNLTPTLDAVVGGTVGVELGDAPRLALIPSVAFEGGEIASLLWNQGLGDPWNVAVSGPPAPDHITDISGGGLYGAIEVPVAFEDADGNSFPGDTELVGPACAGADVAALFWVSPPVEPILAYSLASAGFLPGWLPIRANDADGFVPLTEEEAATLVIGGGCSFE